MGLQNGYHLAVFDRPGRIFADFFNFFVVVAVSEVSVDIGAATVEAPEDFTIRRGRSKVSASNL